jgi:hypothetical protein
MINATVDLLDGQLSKLDRVPVNYVSPDGIFKGVGYKNLQPMYEKMSSHRQEFIDPKTFSYDKAFMSSVQKFIYNLYPVFVYPTTNDNDTFVGVGHKLSPIEVANNMIAYRNYEFVPLDNTDVQKVIRNNFNKLQVNIDNPFMPLSAHDKDTGITVASFKNGVLTEIINQIYKVDIAEAINIVQRQVTVPLSRNQLIAVLSLVFEVKGRRLYSSDMLKVLNQGYYNKAPSYFMDFSELVLPNGKTSINQDIFTRRLAEAELFSNIFPDL